jgi:hypothetical protein
VTNFLGRLVGRAIGAPASRSVRPRVRSRFEPPADAQLTSGVWAEQQPAALDDQRSTERPPSGDQPRRHRLHGTEGARQAEDSVLVAPPEPGPPRTPTAETSPRTEGAALAPAPEPRAQRAPIAGAVPRVARVAPPPPEPGSPPVRPGAPAPPLRPPPTIAGGHRRSQRAGPPRPVPRSPADAPAVPGEPETVTRRAGLPSSPAAAPARAAPVVAARPETSRASEPKLGPQPTHGVLNPRALGIAATPAARPVARRTPPPPATGPDGRPSVAAPHLAFDHGDGEQPEHVVHVTIGRLEVRAGAPAAVPAPAPTRPPRRSSGIGLDDYLRERSEGRRR